MPQYNDYRRVCLKGRIFLSGKDIKRKIRKAIFISDAMEKLFSISKIIDDVSEGIDEIDKEFKRRKKDISKLKGNIKLYR